MRQLLSRLINLLWVEVMPTPIWPLAKEFIFAWVRDWREWKPKIPLENLFSSGQQLVPTAGRAEYHESLFIRCLKHMPVQLA